MSFSVHNLQTTNPNDWAGGWAFMLLSLLHDSRLPKNHELELMWLKNNYTKTIGRTHPYIHTQPENAHWYDVWFEQMLNTFFSTNVFSAFSGLLL